MEDLQVLSGQKRCAKMARLNVSELPLFCIITVLWDYRKRNAESDYILHESEEIADKTARRLVQMLSCQGDTPDADKAPAPFLRFSPAKPCAIMAVSDW